MTGKNRQSHLRTIFRSHCFSSYHFPVMYFIYSAKTLLNLALESIHFQHPSGFYGI